MNEYQKLRQAIHRRFHSGNGITAHSANISPSEWKLIEPALFREGVLAEIEAGIIHTCDHSPECEACDKSATP